MAYDAASQEGRSICEALMRQQTQFEQERANWDTLYQRIAEVCFPRGDFFMNGGLVTQGQLRDEKVFDNTPGLALDRFAAAMDSMLCPATSTWHGLRTDDENLNDIQEVKEYLEAVTRRLFAARYAPRTNFSSQMHEYHLSLGSFGSGAVFVDESVGQALRYRCLHMSEVWFGEDFQGGIDRANRKFMLKAYQVAQLANQPDEARRWSMPPRVQKAIDGQKPMQEFEFLHCVYPNDDIDTRRYDHKGMAFKSCYVSTEDTALVNEGGFRSMPYACGRYVTGPREVYGRSPAMTVLRDILMLNEMNKDVIRAGQQFLMPPWLLSEDGALQAFSLKSNALNYGYLNSEGVPLAQALRPEGNMPISLEMIQDRRTAVNDAFLVTLFQILVENPDMTATQALLRAQEKGQLLGPSLGRQQSEFQGAMIERELDVLSMAGQLPPMPDALRQAGAPVTVEFKAPLNRLQKTEEAVGILRTVEALTGPAQVDPSAFDVFKGKWAKIGRRIAEANGSPADLCNSDEEMAQIEDENQKQQTLGQIVQAAPALAGAARDMAQAQATAGSVPQAIPQAQPSTGPAYP